jgi:hypothetical protein
MGLDFCWHGEFADIVEKERPESFLRENIDKDLE